MLRSRQLGTSISLNALRYLEEGKTKHPDSGALRAVSKLYGLDYDELVAKFVQANYDIDIETESQSFVMGIGPFANPPCL